MSVTVNIPSFIIKQYQDEALAKIRKDLSNINYQNTAENGLLSNRAAAWSLDYINSCSKNEETGGNTLFPLIVRNRKLEELQKTAEAVVSIFQEQNFTVSESLLFLKHIESLLLASPVKY